MNLKKNGKANERMKKQKIVLEFKNLPSKGMIETDYITFVFKKTENIEISRGLKSKQLLSIEEGKSGETQTR